MHSLRLRLVGLWALSLLASVAVGTLLVQLDRQSTRAQVGRAEAVVAHACDLIGDRTPVTASAWRDPDAAQLAALIGLALSGEDGVEGGIWRQGTGSLAYAYPTYQGTGPKTDLPAAERDLIAAINQQAARAGLAVDRRTTTRAQTLLLHACPLPGPTAGLTAWTMTRVQTNSGLRLLQLGLGVLLGLMVVMSAWLGRTLLVWGRHVRGIERALATASPDGALAVPRTGERELDRIIDALNEAGLRLADARRHSDEMAVRVARAERLAGLGRVAAGVAHEIRNPLAAARLQGENALAGDDRRRREAIGDMLGQIDRLDTLVAELLAMTQRVEPRPVAIELSGFLNGAAGRHRETAAAKRLTIGVEVAEQACAARFDPALVDRVLDNLLSNAIRHAPPGGAVTVRAERGEAVLALVVDDTGSGVPSGLAGRLFEPFVTSRPDGTGLGLAIARELADAHGGRLLLRRAGGTRPGEGAAFALELPQEDPWPPC